MKIDLAPIRRELFREMAPNGSLEQMTPEERQRVGREVNQRLLGIVQGLQLTAAEVQKKPKPRSSTPPPKPKIAADTKAAVAAAAAAASATRFQFQRRRLSGATGGAIGGAESPARARRAPDAGSGEARAAGETGAARAAGEAGAPRATGEAGAAREADDAQGGADRERS